MIFKTCPDCGAHLDAGEICECKKEGTPAGTGTPSNGGKWQSSTTSLSDPYWDVKNLLRAKEVVEASGMTAKEIAQEVENRFPKFSRYLLSQATNCEAYGMILHPDAMRIVCETTGYSLVPPVVLVEKEPPARKPEHRRLGRKLTFRMTDSDFQILQDRVEADGFSSVQAWLYHSVKTKLMEVH